MNLITLSKAISLKEHIDQLKETLRILESKDQYHILKLQVVDNGQTRWKSYEIDVPVQLINDIVEQETIRIRSELEKAEKEFENM